MEGKKKLEEIDKSLKESQESQKNQTCEAISYTVQNMKLKEKQCRKHKLMKFGKRKVCINDEEPQIQA